jgi:hypothetical protein
MWHVWGREEVFRGFWWGNLRGEHLQDQDVNERKISEWFFKKWDESTWTGLIWLRIGTFGGLL